MIVAHIKTNDGRIVETVRYGNPTVDRINELSGRTIGAYILSACAKNLRRRNSESAYVAANRHSPWRLTHASQGFHVEVVRTPRA